MKAKNGKYCNRNSEPIRTVEGITLYRPRGSQESADQESIKENRAAVNRIKSELFSLTGTNNNTDLSAALSIDRSILYNLDIWWNSRHHDHILRGLENWRAKINERKKPKEKFTSTEKTESKNTDEYRIRKESQDKDELIMKLREQLKVCSEKERAKESQSGMPDTPTARGWMQEQKAKFDELKAEFDKVNEELRKTKTSLLKFQYKQRLLKNMQSKSNLDEESKGQGCFDFSDTNATQSTFNITSELANGMAEMAKMAESLSKLLREATPPENS